MEKELFAVVAIYKSEAMNYLRDNNIAREDALIIITVEDFEKAKTRLIKDVKLISAPMGLSSNEDDLKKLLLLTREEELDKLLGSVNVQEVKGLPIGKTIKAALDEKSNSPIIGDDSPSNEEVKEILETPLTVEESTKSLQEKVDDIVNAPEKRETAEPEVKTPEIKKPAAKKPVTRKKRITKK